jgi:hypothetical protein
VKSSPKTTVLGICTILTAITSAIIALIDNDPTTVFDVASVIAACTAGVGLIVAKDAKSL